MSPLSKDWTIDFWVKFNFDLDSTSTSFNLLSQTASSCSSLLPRAVLLSVAIHTSTTGMFTLRVDDQIDPSRVPNNHADKIIRPQNYFHVSIINSGAQEELATVLNFTNANPLTPAFDHLSSCDLVIGKSLAGEDLSLSFSLKALRVWSTAMSRDELLLWSTSMIVNQGYPNLILYYRMENDLFVGK